MFDAHYMKFTTTLEKAGAIIWKVYSQWPIGAMCPHCPVNCDGNPSIT